MKLRKGFTLVELLIYISIFAVVGSLLVGVLITNLRTQDRSTAANEVTQQLDFVLGTVQRLVRDASLIDITYEGATTTEACSTYCTLRLRMEDSAREPTIIRSDASGVYLKEGSGEEVSLTTDKIIVDNFKLSKFEVAGGHAALQIDVSFTFNSAKPELAITKTLQSAVSRVTAATFDSDIVPNLNGAWDVGQMAGNKWQDAHFLGTLTVGVDSVVEPSAALQIDSTSKGFLVPRMTTTERDAISSPADGLIIYNTTTNKFNSYRDRKSTRLNSSHIPLSRMPSSA